jgi:hypothetical protein
MSDVDPFDSHVWRPEKGMAIRSGRRVEVESTVVCKCNTDKDFGIGALYDESD